MAIFLNVRANAPITLEKNRRIRIIHAFHPLTGKQFDLLEYRRIYSKSYVYFHDDSGQLRIIPASWTDFVQLDAFVELAAGSSPLHIACLVELADLVQQVGRNKGSGV